MSKKKMVDIERAKLTPEAVFDAPVDVVENEELTRDDKVEILLRWRHTALQLDTAMSENMQGHDRDSQLRAVQLALDKLGQRPG